MNSSDPVKVIAGADYDVLSILTIFRQHLESVVPSVQASDACRNSTRDEVA